MFTSSTICRSALGRDENALLAAGNDGIELLSTVKLLD